MLPDSRPFKLPGPFGWIANLVGVHNADHTEALTRDTDWFGIRRRNHHFVPVSPRLACNRLQYEYVSEGYSSPFLKSTV